MKHARSTPTRPETRQEKDHLGPVDLPDDAWYGAQTQRALSNYPISGQRARPELIQAMLHVKRAAAIANHAAGKLDDKRLELMMRAIDQIEGPLRLLWDEVFPVDVFQAGAGTSENMNINEVIANLANSFVGAELGVYDPIHPNDHVNASQSTNDVFPTAMRIALLAASKPLLEVLHRVSDTLAMHANNWSKIAKSGRTHLQDAVPIHLGDEFSAYERAVSRCGRWIEMARNSLRELGIGGTAVGSGLNTPEGYATRCVAEIARITGETLHVSPNFFYSMQSQAPIAFYSSSLRLLAIELTRICNDIRLLASGPMNGLGEIELPAAQPGSSIMPGKINPSILEMANQVFFAIQGYDHTIALAAQAGQLELNVMMPVMAFSALEATHIATQSLDTLNERCLQGLQPKTERLQRSFENTAQVATALSPRLGYDRVGELVKEATATGRSVLELAREHGMVTQAEIDAIRRGFA